MQTDLSDHVYEEVQDVSHRSGNCLYKFNITKWLFGGAVVFILIGIGTLVTLRVKETSGTNKPSMIAEPTETNTNPSVTGTTVTTPSLPKGSLFKSPNLYCEKVLKKLDTPPVNSKLNSRFSWRIVGGEEVDIKHYPWQVALFHDGKFTCGGVIITEQWITTAAHCTFGKTSHSGWKIYAGDKNIYKLKSADLQSRKAVKIYNHQNYQDSKYHYDIAVIKVDRPFTFTSYVRPICLPDSEKEFPDDLACHVSGWGATKSAGSIVDVLRHVQVNIINWKVCQLPSWMGSSIKDYMLCAGKEDGGRDSCGGDSGGPLSCYVKSAATWKLAGVVSWGVECAIRRTPGVYSSAHYFKDWIWDYITKDGGVHN